LIYKGFLVENCIVTFTSRGVNTSTDPKPMSEQFKSAASEPMQAAKPDARVPEQLPALSPLIRPDAHLAQAYSP
jgi:hypothetical protein